MLKSLMKFKAHVDSLSCWSCYLLTVSSPPTPVGLVQDNTVPVMLNPDFIFCDYHSEDFGTKHNIATLNMDIISKALIWINKLGLQLYSSPCWLSPLYCEI